MSKRDPGGLLVDPLRLGAERVPQHVRMPAGDEPHVGGDAGAALVGRLVGGVGGVIDARAVVGDGVVRGMLPTLAAGPQLVTAGLKRLAAVLVVEVGSGMGGFLPAQLDRQ